jgi:hypothetical protein
MLPDTMAKRLAREGVSFAMRIISSRYQVSSADPGACHPVLIGGIFKPEILHAVHEHQARAGTVLQTSSTTPRRIPM